MRHALGSLVRTMTLALALLPQATLADDGREKIAMPAPMTAHMLANMRDHLLALTEIQRAIGAGDWKVAADVAERRIGMTSLQSHGAAHMAGFMPAPMQEIGTRMHRAASRFALVAQESAADGNVARSVAALSAVMEQCVACHAGYRVH